MQMFRVFEEMVQIHEIEIHNFEISPERSPIRRYTIVSDTDTPYSDQNVSDTDTRYIVRVVSKISANLARYVYQISILYQTSWY